MTDFSVGKVNNGIQSSFKTESNDDFSRAKSEYQKFREKISKSDFANAPVSLRDELKMLDDLKFCAEKSDKTSELSWIENRISEINNILSTPPKEVFPSSYYKPVFAENNKKNVSFGALSDNDYKKGAEEFLNSDGDFVANAEEIVNVLKSGKVTPYQAKIILSRCKNVDDTVSSEMADGLKNLVSSEFSPSVIPEFIEEFSQYNEKTGEKYIPDDVLLNTNVMKSAGITDRSVIKFIKLLNSGFEDKGQIVSYLKNLNRAKLKDDDIVEILNVLAVKNPKNEKVINKSAVNSVVSMKNALVRTQNNEIFERMNPLSKLGEKVFEDDVEFIFTKDGKFLYSYDKEGNPPEVVKERYFESVAQKENAFLIEFAKKYKNDDGEIDINALRVAVALRNAGITISSLPDLTDLCIQNGEIDSDTFDTVVQLKKSGALSDDIVLLLDGIEKNADGKYDESSISDVCELTKNYIVSEDAVKLLPKIKNDTELKDSITGLSSVLEDKRILMPLLELCTDENGKIDTNSTETVYYLFSNNLKNSKYSEKEMIEKSKEILSSGQNLQTKQMNDDSTGIVSIMTHNGADFEDIKSAVDLCKNSDGNVDEKLSRILWDLGVQKAELPEIKSFIDICKNENGNVNTDKADMIITLLDNGFTKEKISDLLFR